MAAYQCLNCEQIEHSGEDCCDKPNLLCINDMPQTILRLRAALRKIADWDSNWGPFPENNENWRAMAVTTAREAVPKGND